jgi:hypothetical protein
MDSGEFPVKAEKQNMGDGTVGGWDQLGLLLFFSSFCFVFLFFVRPFFLAGLSGLLMLFA